MNTASRKKTILVAYDLSPKLGSEAGKANQWLKAISQHYDVHVFTDAFHQKAISTEKYENVTFYFIKGNRSLRELLWKLNAVNVSNAVFCTKVSSHIKKLLKKDKFSLIHCITPSGVHSYNGLYALGIPVLAGPLGGGIPAPKGFEKAFDSQYTQNSLRDIFYKTLIKIPGWKRYFRNSKKILVGTKYLLDILPADVHEKAVIMFDTVVDEVFFNPGQGKNKRNGPVKKIIFSGILESKKGVTLLIEAVRLCLQQGNYRFLVEIAGDGALKDKLTQMIKEYDLESHVKLLGMLPKSELLKKYQESDIFCSPTLREPGGGAILEAMACGLPVITSNYGGPAFSVTKECGIKIEMTDYDTYAKDLGDAIIDLVTDDERRINMGLKARERIEKEFSTQALERRISGIYKQVIEE